MISVRGVARAAVVAAMVISAWASAASAGVIADSVQEFSGVQGQDNWFYGYYDGDGGTPFSNSDFEEFSNFSGRVWSIQLGCGGYWTQLYAEGGHPNGTNTSGGRQEVVHWAVRRWVSDVSGPITITGNMSDRYTSSYGNGVVCHIIIGGEQILTQTISRNDTTGVDYEVSANVGIGSSVDFAIDPRGNNDHGDHTRFTAVLTPEPATLSLLAVGGLAVMARRRKTRQG